MCIRDRLPGGHGEDRGGLVRASGGPDDNDRTDRDQGKDHHGPYDKEDPGRSREKDGNDRNHRRIYRGGEDPNQEYYAGPL